MKTPLQILDKFRGLRVLVIGDLILDSYLEGSSSRLCREAPVPIIDFQQENLYPGGAANTAANIAALGARCSVFSVLGRDEEAGNLRYLLMNQGVDMFNVLGVPNRKTLFKQRIVADSQIVARIDKGDCTYSPLGSEQELLLHILEDCYKSSTKEQLDAVVVSDYGYGSITPEILIKLQQLQSVHNKLLAVDAKDLNKYKLIGPTVVTPNYLEAAALLGIPVLPVRADRISQILDCGETLLDQLNTKIAIVTLDRDGALVFENGVPPKHIPTSSCTIGHPGGAGDTFIATLTLALCAGATTRDSVEIATKAATYVVSFPGTTQCSLENLCRSLTEQEGENKFLTDFQLQAVLKQHRERGAKIAFTNGCFDLLHHGHLQHLKEAADQGTILIVGLNTDESIRRLKGNSRPIQPYHERAAALAALSCVNYVLPLAEDNAIELIKKVRPDVYVKGGDYVKESLPEASVVEELGGEVRILPLHLGYSTTKIIDRIRGQEVGVD
jgi:D-beta-D-heptose 7-phosphate kinase/D-beta-D-heptose 1-phosphate adenosyltransferase